MTPSPCDLAAMPPTAPANAIVLHPPAPIPTMPTATVLIPTAATDDTAAARVVADCPFAWTYLSTHICDNPATMPRTGVTGSYGPALTTTQHTAPSSIAAHGSGLRSAGEKVHVGLSVLLVVLAIHVLVALYPQ